MRTRIFALWLLLAAATAAAFAGNRISIAGAEGAPGDVVTVMVSMESDTPAEGMQLSLPLPEGTVFTGDATALGRAHEMRVQGGVRGGRLNLTLFSLNRAAIAAGSGKVMSFGLRLGATPMLADLAPEAVLVGADGSRLEVSCDEAVLRVKGAALSLPQREYGLGRVALGEPRTFTVTVANTGTDVLNISGLSGAPEGWSLAAPLSVAPGDRGAATVRVVPSVRGRDVTLIRFDSNASGESERVIVTSEGFGRNEMFLTTSPAKGGEEALVGMTLKNYDGVCGFTAKVELPRGFGYVPGSFAIDGARAVGHGTTATVEEGRNGKTTVTLTAYSLTNKPFAGHEGIVATFRVLVASRNGATLGLKSAVLPALIDSKVTDVASAFGGAYMSVSSPTLNVARTQNLGRTPVTQAEAGSFSFSNYGSESLTVSSLDIDDEALHLSTPLPITISPWSSATLSFTRSDDARGELRHLVRLHSNDPETPVLALDLTMDRYSPNELTLEAYEADEGDPLVLRLLMDNNDDIEGLQFDLNFDASLAGTLVAEPTERAAGLRTNVSRMADGRMRVVAYSMGGAIARGSGPVMTLTLTPATACAEGSYTLTASDIVLGNSSMENLHSATVVPQTSLTVNFFLLGDLNADRTVSPVDINLMISHLASPESVPVKLRAADMNGDGNIMASDLNLLINTLANSQ